MTINPIFVRASSFLKGFRARRQVSLCFVQHQENLLLLRRVVNSREGGKWGVPGGKVEAIENEWQAIIREMHEETGWRVNKEDLSKRVTLYERIPEMGDYILHIFKMQLQHNKPIQINKNEHSEYKWVSCDEFLNTKDLMLGQQQLYQYVFKDEVTS